ncbi:Peptidoglycan-recognition protein SA [Eumeta japonica]|uniref:Peptidoglycan-recognition protein SA n=1 Tax=Eumeta variegata TaxID=151549 RepID=A0A4C1TTV0_EUMVA|nr:Peptidoglycan-recognition protein SA [Eumeta japonica]
MAVPCLTGLQQKYGPARPIKYHTFTEYKRKVTAYGVAICPVDTLPSYLRGRRRTDDSPEVVRARGGDDLLFAGSHTSKEPTAAALQAAKDLLQCGVNKSYLSADYRLVAHRQVRPTKSPGARLYGLLAAWPHWTRHVDAPALVH